MKYFIFLSCIYIFSFNVKAQSKIDIKNDYYNDNLLIIQQGGNIVLDSSYYYLGNNDEWKLVSRRKSVKRNEKGISLEEINHCWNIETEKWKLKDTISNKYFNTTTQLKSRLKRPWLNGQNIWGDTTFYIEYDKNKNELSSISKNWDYKNNKASRGFNSQYSYDDNNLIKSEIIKTLDTTTLKWENNNKLIYSYDDKNRKDTVKHEFWIWGDWELFQIDIYEYNNQSQLITKLIRQSALGVNIFKNKEKQIYTYDDKGNLKETLVKSWADNIWINKRKIIDRYDERNNRIRRTYTSYKDDKWINSLRVFYKYNNEDKQIEYLTELWDIDKGFWINSTKTTRDYNTSGNLILRIKQNWNDKINQWVNVNKNVFYLSEFDPSGILTPSLDKAYIYPNPTSGEINFSDDSVYDISIYDINGKLIKMSVNTRDININDQPPGFYFMEYFEKGKKSLLKIIKE